MKFKCDDCSKEYSRKNVLKSHILKVHSGLFTKYGCSICDAKFMSKQNRDNHVVAKHTGEKAFQCEECPSKFSNAGLLRAHRFVHSDEKPHKCSMCPMACKRKGDLASHLKTWHSLRRKDFECSTCHKTFFDKFLLNKHSKVHAIGDFSCYFCKKEFIHRVELENHLRTHTQEKPFFCPERFCQYSCADPSSLHFHMKHHHTNPSLGDEAAKTSSCYFCAKTHTQFKTLVIHMRNHTLEEPFPCGLCPRLFKSGDSLGRHISAHIKEKPFSCPHCGKCFSQSGNLKRHVATHTGEKRLFCEFCNYSSFLKSNFMRHLSKRH